MIKIKPVIICSSAAFVLSFATALIAKSGFGFSLLKAAIFAVVFGAIAFAVQVIYGKFLAQGEAAPSEDAVQEQKNVGSKIDLVVSEEDLPEDKEAPEFKLDSVRHVVTAEDVGLKAENMRPPVPPAQKASPAPQATAAAQTTAAPNAQNAAFVGTQNSDGPQEGGVQKTREEAASNAEKASAQSEGSPLQGAFATQPLATPSAQSAEKASAENAAGASDAASKNGQASDAEKGGQASAFVPTDLAKDSSAKPSNSSSEELPELDDFPGLGVAQEADGEEGVERDDIIEDSDFAAEGAATSSRQTEFPDGKVADAKDASLMAQAIRTALVQDE